MKTPTFNIGDRVVVKDPEDFKRDIGNALRGRVGIIADPRHTPLPGRVYVNWQPRKRDRRDTLQRCPAWMNARDLVAAPTEGGAP